MISKASVQRLPLANEEIYMIATTSTPAAGLTSGDFDRLSASTVLWGDYPPRVGSTADTSASRSSCASGL